MIGQTISHYRILEKLGEGGMGVVYKAEDLKLHRFVALKFLPKGLEAEEPERARLLQEAQAASALNHPNVCTIYDIKEEADQRFILMEYVDGRTLKQISPIQKIEDAIAYATQIGEALQEAHSHGIVHRDVKPENIMVTTKNHVKVMDFGLAKLKGSLKLTKKSSTLGTLAYMAPEQILGGEVDARSDIFSFGIVLYEMLTGHLPFRGEHEAAMMYSIVHESPEPVQKYRRELPLEWSHIIDRALEKDPADRYQSVSDILIDLRRLRKATSKVTRSVPGTLDSETLDTNRRLPTARSRTMRSKKVLFPALAVVSLALVSAVLYMIGRQPSKRVSAVHKQITFNGKVSFPTISPDGKSIAYVVEDSSGEKKVLLQDLSGGPPLELLSGSRFVDMRWAPDGSQILVSGRVQDRWGSFLVPRLGGTYRRFSYYPCVNWSPVGSRFAGTWHNSKRIQIVDATTADTTSIATRGAFEWLLDVDWSPKGNLILYLRKQQNSWAVATIPLDGSKQSIVAEEPVELFSPRWSSGGDAIYYLRADGQTKDLMKVRIDQTSGKTSSGPSIVQSGLEAGTRFSIARDNAHLMYTREHSCSNLWLVRYEQEDSSRIISKMPLTKGTSTIYGASISPDGQKIACAMGNASQSNIYVMSIEDESIRQLTFLGSFNTSPVWSPDGKEIAFASPEGGLQKVWKVNAAGGTPRSFGKTLVSHDSPVLEWSPNKEILYQRPGNRNFHFVDPDTEVERPLVSNDSVGWMFCPRYSLDGKQIAVTWNRRPVGLWIVSPTDGSQTLLHARNLGAANPVTWSPDGKLIYICETDLATDYWLPKISAANTVSGETEPFLTLPFEYMSSISMDSRLRLIVCIVPETQSDAWLMESFDADAE